MSGLEDSEKGTAGRRRWLRRELSVDAVGCGAVDDADHDGDVVAA